MARNIISKTSKVFSFCVDPNSHMRRLWCGRNSVSDVHVWAGACGHTCRGFSWGQSSSWVTVHFIHWDRAASWTQSLSPCWRSPCFCLPGPAIQVGYCTHPTLMWGSERRFQHSASRQFIHTVSAPVHTSEVLSVYQNLLNSWIWNICLCFFNFI